MRSFTALFFAVFILLSCVVQEVELPVFHADENPRQLSDWQILEINNDRLNLTDRVIPYDLNSPLFSDYAHKLRTIWIPEGQMADYRKTATFDFPIGTIISKTFFYPIPASGGSDTVLKADENTSALLKNGFDLKTIRLIETRLLVRRDAGWAALPYVWNENQTEANLKRVGDIRPLTLVKDGLAPEAFNYVVPNVNQCAGCHATNATSREIFPIGPKARHLNKTFDYKNVKKNQLRAWQDKGVLSSLPSSTDIPKNADWSDTGAALDARARAYLDVNCAHCHNSVGPADTSGLHLEPHSPDGSSLGRCKLPIAAGTGTGDRAFDIVPGKPDESIFTYRLASTDPAVMMPELGRTLSHSEGVTLIAEWIAAMEGTCDKG